MLTIRCLVYNHEPYLRQCLDGFVKQKTNFRFEAIVHDDCSTDKSAEIIAEYAEKYPDIIKPIFETENQYSKHDGSLRRIMNAHTKGKYIALCEGDDYWKDPNKLQKQVDFLENNPSYGMVHTYANIYDQQSGQFSGTVGNEFNSINELLKLNTVATLTVLFRSDLKKSYDKDVGVHKEWLMGDYPLWLYITIKSKVHFLKEKTSVYRLLRESASHSSDLRKKIRFRISSNDICSFFIKKYSLKVNLKDYNRKNNCYKSILYLYDKKYFLFFKYLVLGLPISLRYIKVYINIILKRI